MADARTLQVHLAHAALPAALPRLVDLLGRYEVVVVRLTGPDAADLRTVSALARLLVTVRRVPGRLVVRGGAHLRELVLLAGLAEVVPVEPDSGEPEGQPHLGEQLLADEVVDVADPPA